jgi:hypothetical protein
MEATKSASKQKCDKYTRDMRAQGETAISLKSELNKASHYLAQASEIRIRYALEAKCRSMLKAGKSANDVSTYLSRAVSEGASGLDALLRWHKEAVSAPPE